MRNIYLKQVVVALENKKIKNKNTHFRRAPPGRLGSSFMRLPAMSLLFNDLSAASAALTS